MPKVSETVQTHTLARLLEEGIKDFMRHNKDFLKARIKSKSE